MDIKRHTHPDALEKYSFLWSEARLLVAALALFIGGVPPVWYLFSGVAALYGVVSAGLTLAWIISGLASAYLLYRWIRAKWMVFQGKKSADVVAMAVSVISGINLGIAGLFGRNIGMTAFPWYGFLLLAGLAYLVSAYHLWMRWNASGKKIF